MRRANLQASRRAGAIDDSKETTDRGQAQSAILQLGLEPGPANAEIAGADSRTKRAASHRRGSKAIRHNYPSIQGIDLPQRAPVTVCFYGLFAKRDVRYRFVADMATPWQARGEAGFPAGKRAFATRTAATPSVTENHCLPVCHPVTSARIGLVGQGNQGCGRMTVSLSSCH